MNAFELYALETFLKIQDNFPEHYHWNVYKTLLKVYCAWNWPLLTDEYRSAFYAHENSINSAADNEEVLVPILIAGKLELMAASVLPAEVFKDRTAKYGPKCTDQMEVVEKDNHGEEEENTYEKSENYLENRAEKSESNVDKDVEEEPEKESNPNVDQEEASKELPNTIEDNDEIMHEETS